MKDKRRPEPPVQPYQLRGAEKVNLLAACEH